jgi:hypothetical protein
MVLTEMFSRSFDAAFTRLKRMEQKKASSSKKIHDCMRLPKDNPLTVHNFFADKFDSTGDSMHLICSRADVGDLTGIFICSME